MLMTQAFTKLLTLVDNGVLAAELFAGETLARVRIALFQGCFRTLLRQESNGSWEDSVERTAYAILILHEARQVHFQCLRSQLDQGILRGRKFLPSAKDKRPDYIWIEKVTYASPMLSSVYRLAALRACATDPDQVLLIGRNRGPEFNHPALMKHAVLLMKTPLFSQIPVWQMTWSAIEVFSSHCCVGGDLTSSPDTV